MKEDLLERINRDLRNTLSEKRYNHSVGVMKKAEELAKKYNIDVQKAKIVGLAHDIAKEMPKPEKIKYVKQNHIHVDEIERINIELLHAKIGADICKKKYGFSRDMQNAIKYHTTGNKNMDNLAKLILIADKIEDGRNYKDLEQAQKIADNSLDETIVYIIDMSLKKTIEKGRFIHPDSIYTRNSILKKIK